MNKTGELPTPFRSKPSKPARLTLKVIGQIAWETIHSTVSGDSLSQGAALSYYTVFAIAPLFVIALALAGLCFGEQAAHQQLFGQLNLLLGDEGGKAIEALVAAADKSRSGFWATTIAIITLLIAATGVFAQLQNSLNRIWNIQSAPGRSFRNFIRHRLLSFAMVFGIGFILLVSLVISAALAAVGDWLSNYITGQEIFLKTVETLLSLAAITVLFAMIFKFLPDIKIAWRDVWLGGFITAILFQIGKYLIGLYIAKSTLASVYGGTGSLIIVLLWVYYSAQILFFGAHFTRIYATRFGQPQPLPGTKLAA